MRRIIGTTGATLAIVVVMATSAGLAEASHREQKILQDPTADNTDVYASTTPGASGWRDRGAVRRRKRRFG